MRRITVLAALLVSLTLALATQALGVNDPFVPGDNCSAGTQAVGHPAVVNNQTPDTAANPPFSSNNPGVSTGAQALLHSQALNHCPNA